MGRDGDVEAYGAGDELEGAAVAGICEARRVEVVAFEDADDGREELDGVLRSRLDAGGCDGEGFARGLPVDGHDIGEGHAGEALDEEEVA